MRMCPKHAMARHISRLRRGGAVPDSPQCPDLGGAVPAKETVCDILQNNHSLGTIASAGVPVYHGRRRQTDRQFARVSGAAQFLATNGIAVTTLQLLGGGRQKALNDMCRQLPCT